MRTQNNDKKPMEDMVCFKWSKTDKKWEENTQKSMKKQKEEKHTKKKDQKQMEGNTSHEIKKNTEKRE